MVATRRSPSCSPAGKTSTCVESTGIQKRSSNTRGDVPPLKGLAVDTPTILHDDGIVRCNTAYTGCNAAEYIKYHDEEWGVPSQDDAHLMEHLVLSCFQCGLTWAAVLRKRSAYAAAFKQYDVQSMATMGEADVERLSRDDSGIIRNRVKIRSSISNAKVVVAVQQEHGSFAAYLWGLLPDGRPVINQWRARSDVPASTPLAESVSTAMKKRGFKFVGPTMMYAFMQATGMVHDHIVTCFRYSSILSMHEDIQEKCRQRDAVKQKMSADLAV
eukprot:jgi/Ulvmu1/8296/UM042_0001.1